MCTIHYWTQLSWSKLPVTTISTILYTYMYRDRRCDKTYNEQAPTTFEFCYIPFTCSTNIKKAKTVHTTCNAWQCVSISLSFTVIMQQKYATVSAQHIMTFTMHSNVYICYMAFAFALVLAFVFSFFFRPSMFAFRTLAYAYNSTV